MRKLASIFIIVLACMAADDLYAQNVFPSSGQVGITTTTPDARLHVYGYKGNILRLTSYPQEGDGDLIMSHRNRRNGFSLTFGADIITSTSTDYGYQTNRGASRLMLSNGSIGFYTSNFVSGAAVGDVIPGLNFDTPRMLINQFGQVGINVSYNGFEFSADIPTDQSYKLAVKGKIIAEEVKVQLASNWPDYVFADDYELLSLNETAAYIEGNKHLPGVPSEEEVAREEGILVGEMNRILLEKIEELYLHTIAQEERIEEQNKRITELEQKLVE